MQLRPYGSKLPHVVPPCFATASRQALLTSPCRVPVTAGDEPQPKPWPYNGSPPEQTTDALAVHLLGSEAIFARLQNTGFQPGA